MLRAHRFTVRANPPATVQPEQPARRFPPVRTVRADARATPTAARAFASVRHFARRLVSPGTKRRASLIATTTEMRALRSTPRWEHSHAFRAAGLDRDRRP